MRREGVIIVGVLFVLGVGYSIWADSLATWQQKVQTTALWATVVVVAWYTWETHRLRKSQADAQSFSAMTTIHGVVSSPEQMCLRRALYLYFDDALKYALDKLPPHEGKPRQLELFNANLNSKRLDGYQRTQVGALDAVEQVLGCFDLVAVLVIRLDNELARQAVHAFIGRLLRATAPRILPFVQIQRRLREDENYREEYVELLRCLGVSSEFLARYGMADGDRNTPRAKEP